MYAARLNLTCPYHMLINGGVNFGNLRARSCGVVVETLAWRSRCPEINPWRRQSHVFCSFPKVFPYRNVKDNTTLGACPNIMKSKSEFTRKIVMLITNLSRAGGWDATNVFPQSGIEPGTSAIYYLPGLCLGGIVRLVSTVSSVPGTVGEKIREIYII